MKPTKSSSNFPFFNDWFGLSENMQVEIRQKPDLSSHKDAWQAIKEACLKFQECTDLPIRLLYSGGMDSEIIARALLDLGIPFKAVVASFNTDKNSYDLEYALEFCKNNNVEYEIIDIDVQEIIDNYSSYLDQYNFKGLSSLVYVKIREAYGSDFSFIRGEGEPRFIRHQDHGWLIQFSKTAHSELMAAVRNLGYKDAPMFYMYTPDVYYYYLIDQDVKVYLDVPEVNTILQNKHKIFNRKGLNFAARKKQTGFENYDWSGLKGGDNVVYYPLQLLHTKFSS